MTTELRIPDVGESIQEVQISHWLKQEGDQVQEDENIVELETEKASMELPSPITGILKILKKEGEAAAIGETIAYVDEAAQPSAKKESTETASSKDEVGRSKRSAIPAATSQVSTASQVPAKEDSPDDVSPQKESVKTESSKTESDQHGRSESEKVPSQNEDSRPGQTKEVPSESRDAVRPNGQSSVSDQEQNHARPTPSARRALREYGLEADEVEAAGKQLRREDVLRHVERQKHSQRDDGTAPAPTTQSPTQKQRLSVPGKQNKLRADDSPLEEVVPMTMIRRRIAERLVAAQSQAALLTTYNEIDMSSVLALRKEFGDRFRERYEVKLGFMSFFVKAVIDALKEVPELNAEIRGTDIVYRHRYDIGIAVGSQYGLVVPVVRNADRLSFAEIERTIADFAARANDKKLLPQELSGGTFTISNGGIYGSLLSTPIVNPPQSGVLGMHTIQERPVARDGQVVIRPMMYVALTYDHRIIDGREAVTWLRRVKETIEQPSRMLIEA